MKGWTYVRTYARRTIFSEPKFLGCTVYRINNLTHGDPLIIKIMEMIVIMIMITIMIITMMMITTILMIMIIITIIIILMIIIIVITILTMK